MAAEFIEALMVEDYEAAMERMMFGKDGTFVDADGAAWYLPRTDLRIKHPLSGVLFFWKIYVILKKQ